MTNKLPGKFSYKADFIPSKNADEVAIASFKETIVFSAIQRCVLRHIGNPEYGSLEITYKISPEQILTASARTPDDNSTKNRIRLERIGDRFKEVFPFTNFGGTGAIQPNPEYDKPGLVEFMAVLKYGAQEKINFVKIDGGFSTEITSDFDYYDHKFVQF